MGETTARTRGLRAAPAWQDGKLIVARLLIHLESGEPTRRLNHCIDPAERAEQRHAQQSGEAIARPMSATVPVDPVRTATCVVPSPTRHYFLDCLVRTST
jgi:hypothetical protein